MPRLAVLVVLLLAMLWQSVAMARIGSSVNVLADPEHAALHWHEKEHHHHDDGSLHVGDSDDSAQHVLSDHVNAGAAILTTGAAGLLAVGSTPPIIGPAVPWPDRTLDGLLRPPRAHS